MAQKVVKVGVKKESGYLYFVDKNGDISRAKMARGGKKKAAKKAKPRKKVATKRATKKKVVRKKARRR